jgi:hypothetical protein
VSGSRAREEMEVMGPVAGKKGKRKRNVRPPTLLKVLRRVRELRSQILCGSDGERLRKIEQGIESALHRPVRSRRRKRSEGMETRRVDRPDLLRPTLERCTRQRLEVLPARLEAEIGRRLRFVDILGCDAAFDTGDGVAGGVEHTGDGAGLEAERREDGLERDGGIVCEGETV